MPTTLHPVITALINDHLDGLPDTVQVRQDRAFLKEASREFWVVTVAEARTLLEPLVGSSPLAPAFNEYCARIGFLRASNALSRSKMGKSWRPARTLSS